MGSVVARHATSHPPNTWVDVEQFGKTKQLWFEKFLELENGVPSHDTFSRVFGLLDSQEFLLCLRNWLVTLGKTLKHEGIAIDGKTLRGSFDATIGKSALHVVSAWACGLRVSLGQVAVDGKSTEETAYYITSLEPKVKRLEKLIRGHWGIENTLHWTLDVIFAEDASRIRKGHGPEIAAIFRKIALMILQRDASVPGSIRGKRLPAGWDNDIRERILSGFSED